MVGLLTIIPLLIGKLGADIVIGVDVQDDLRDRTTLRMLQKF
jgi:hypothetical protein